MGKRKSSDRGSGHKKQKVGAVIEPNTTGIYVTCARGKENQCKLEVMRFFGEKIEAYYDTTEVSDEEDEEELSIEQQIEREVNDLKESTKSKKALIVPMDLGVECVVFFKTRKPIVPETFVERLCKESLESKVKTTRFTQKLSPVTFSVSPTLEELRKLSARVLGPHFHQKDNKPYKFAIQVGRRNFSMLEKDAIIKTVAECVGRDHGHSVDLKNYDKLIIIECFKSNIGMSVVNNYDLYERYNLQQIFEKHAVSEGFTRVKTKEKKEEKNEAKEEVVEEKETVEKKEEEKEEEEEK